MPRTTLFNLDSENAELGKRVAKTWEQLSIDAPEERRFLFPVTLDRMRKGRTMSAFDFKIIGFMGIAILVERMNLQLAIEDSAVDNKEAVEERFGQIEELLRSFMAYKKGHPA